MDGFLAGGSNGSDPDDGPNGLIVDLVLIDTAGVADLDASAAVSWADEAGLFESKALSNSSKSMSLRSLSSSRRTCAAPSSKSGSAARATSVLGGEIFRSDMSPPFLAQGHLRTTAVPGRDPVGTFSFHAAAIAL
jgi:hypothetical protein